MCKKANDLAVELTAGFMVLCIQSIAKKCEWGKWMALMVLASVVHYYIMLSRYSVSYSNQESISQCTILILLCRYLQYTVATPFQSLIVNVYIKRPLPILQ